MFGWVGEFSCFLVCFDYFCEFLFFLFGGRLVFCFSFFSDFFECIEVVVFDGLSECFAVCFSFVVFLNCFVECFLVVYSFDCFVVGDSQECLVVVFFEGFSDSISGFLSCRHFFEFFFGDVFFHLA